MPSQVATKWWCSDKRQFGNIRCFPFFLIVAGSELAAMKLSNNMRLRPFRSLLGVLDLKTGQHARHVATAC